MSADDKREIFVILLCIAGLFVIYKLVPLLYGAIIGFFGLKYSRPISLLFAALFMYLWGRFCFYLRYKSDEDEGKSEK